MSNYPSQLFPRLLHYFSQGRVRVGSVEAPKFSLFGGSTQPVSSEHPSSATSINSYINGGEIVQALDSLAAVPIGYDVVVDVPAECDSHLLASGSYAFTVADEGHWRVPLLAMAQSLRFLYDISADSSAALEVARVATGEDSIESSAARRAITYLFDADGAAQVTHATSPNEVFVASTKDGKKVGISIALIQPHLSLRRAFDNDFNHAVNAAEAKVNIPAPKAVIQPLNEGIEIEFGPFWASLGESGRLADLQQRLRTAAREYNAKMVYIYATNTIALVDTQKEAENLRRRVKNLERKLTEEGQMQAKGIRIENWQERWRYRLGRLLSR